MAGLDLCFSCTACGACCYGATRLMLDEAVRLADRLPIGFGWLALDKANFVAPQFRHMRMFSVTIPIEAGVTAKVLPYIITMTPGRAPCPALADNRCTLHGGDKPIQCKVVPGDAMVPLDQPYPGVPGFMKKCPQEAFTGRPLLKRGKLVDPESVAAHKAVSAMAKRDLSVLNSAIELVLTQMSEDGIADDEVCRLFVSMGGEQQQRASIAPQRSGALVFAAAAKLGRLTRESAMAACEKQIALVERLLPEWRNLPDAERALVEHRGTCQRE